MKGKILIILTSLIAIMLGIYMWVYYEKPPGFLLNKEPDYIFSNPCTDLLAVVNDGQLYLYDKNGVSRQITTSFRIEKVCHFNKSAMVIDENHNLYSIEYGGGEIIISDVILSDIVYIQGCTNALDEEKCRSYIAIDKKGYVYVWGCNNEYVLGNNVDKYIEQPMRVQNVQNAKKAYIYNMNAIIITHDGKMYQSGYKGYDGKDTIYYRDFTEIFCDEKVVDFWMGCITILSFGKNVRHWGISEHSGFINNNEFQEFYINHSIESFSSGYSFCLCISSEGDVYIWGENIFEQPSDKSDSLYFYAPTKVKGISGADGIYSAATVGYVKKGKHIYILK